MTRYNALFFHIEWIRSIGYRSDTLTTHAFVYKNHMVLDNIILKRFYYISNNLDSSWLSSVSIESTGEFCAGAKVGHIIFMEIHVLVSKEVSIQDFINIIQHFSYFVLPSTWIILTYVFGVVCNDHLYNCHMHIRSVNGFYIYIYIYIYI